ncbi:outer membrane protein assembly factor BamB family protein [Orenia marismortui]|uniref:outer membrane protein assembly factor BamB family protein n=1 Tax=Orenia marismortui TaxID=46469 RepID=UPI00037E4694|nr:PQQ-binding-like beta-propeller repeat protein [Orenia marismortui]
MFNKKIFMIMLVLSVLIISNIGVQAENIVQRNGSIYSVDRDGDVRWSYTYSKYNQAKKLAADTTPAIDDEMIYFTDNKFFLYAIDSTGDLKWQFPIFKNAKLTSPAVASNGTIFVGTSEGVLYAVKSDSQLDWKFEVPVEDNDDRSLILDDDEDEKLALTDLAVAKDGTIYFGVENGFLYAVNSDGEEKWSIKLADAGELNSPVVTKGGHISITSRAGDSYLVGADGKLK